MAVPAAASVRDANRYRPPTVTGLVDLLDAQVRERPYARALVVTGERVHLSYRGLAALADGVAARLGGTGLCRGDAVGLICANTAEFVVALLGAARAGLVAAPLDPALPASQLSARIAALGARAVLLGPAATSAPLPVPVWPLRVDVSRAGTAAVVFEPGAGAAPQVRSSASELTAHDALVLFTAGTSDRAKMVPLTHANVAASVHSLCATYELGPDDATVAVMPFFHGHGLFAALLASLASGGCVLLPERGRFTAGTFWNDMRAVSATWFTAAPAIHEILLDRSEREYPGPQAPALKFVRSGSAPLNPATQRALERTFGAPLLSAYGMTESSHQATSEPLPGRGALKHGSVGRPTGVEVRVLDRGGRACPVGVEGELWVHGPTVARGYLGDREETAYTFVDGWLRTGDLGTLDADGYLSLTGRIKNLINRGGEKISPEHVEDILAGCPGVAEAAVFAVPDTVYGQRVGAAVVVREGESVGPEEILRYCRDRLAAFEVPDRLELVTALPYTAKGGLDRKAVQARYAP
ncbi:MULTISPECIES: FadD7 family fatty acid--CoA ligase [unclassified Streptomyces]|uniref:FadD7 family fatty acid--CoA ligase n=1 Tax=unclassified Streptomyces TaxID=2593676 RepID=UPI002251339C|nr:MULTISPECIES: FadD7 family fatty acid--CoA ligase [unclassified Streptomyces]MCX5330156.1 FadD7 family fatty acid--CoA ligase [Streptomyces sp. NBC_00140]MCX5359556.1 FadD7 family fatty acid--CoA ligase [Streptomyces sp. NBC_00124]